MSFEEQYPADECAGCHEYEQERVRLTARLAEAEGAVKEERTSRVAAYIALRAIRIELVAWVLRNMDTFACFSGDCPHDMNSECIESIIQQYEEDEAAKGGE